MAKAETPIVLIHNAETGKVEQVEMTAEEITRMEKLAKEAETARLQFEKAKESAFEKLAALGLTEAEIQALTA